MGMGINARARGERGRQFGWKPPQTTEDFYASVQAHVDYWLWHIFGDLEHRVEGELPKRYALRIGDHFRVASNNLSGITSPAGFQGIR